MSTPTLIRADPRDAGELESIHTLFSRTLGLCRVCGHDPRDQADQETHLEQHLAEITPEGIAEARLPGCPAWAGASVRRRLGLLLWKLHGRGWTAAQLERDLRLPRGLTDWALSVPRGQRDAVHHLHRQGLLSGEIAEALELPPRVVEKRLSGADWKSWAEACCPPRWGSMPLLGPAVVRRKRGKSETAP